MSKEKRLRNNTSKLTPRLIEKFLKDEREANKTYKKLGLVEMARDEKSHAAILSAAKKKLQQQKH